MKNKKNLQIKYFIIFIFILLILNPLLNMNKLFALDHKGFTIGVGFGIVGSEVENLSISIESSPFLFNFISLRATYSINMYDFFIFNNLNSFSEYLIFHSVSFDLIFKFIIHELINVYFFTGFSYSSLYLNKYANYFFEYFDNSYGLIIGIGEEIFFSPKSNFCIFIEGGSYLFTNLKVDLTKINYFSNTTDTALLILFKNKFFEGFFLKFGFKYVF
jgi:hypothetical protein